MTIKHNQQIQENHFRKDWQRRVRCHFDQAGRKKSRRNARVAKAAKVAPRPVDLLRPIVRCPTLKYNRKVRAGRGFTFEELKAAGLSPKYAATVGIAVDHRRVNISEESLQVNVARLKSYLARLIVFPRRVGKHKQGDASKEDLRGVNEGKFDLVGIGLPVLDDAIANAVTHVSKGDMPKQEGSVFRRLRDAKIDQRLVGIREKQAKAKAEEAAAAKK